MTSIKILRHIAILLLCHLWFSSYAQLDEKKFRQITIADGLSDNTITAICQDDRGYIWIGTHDGLNRYDGRTFKKIFATDPSTPLPNSKITGLKNFADDKLGIVTPEGFQVLDTKTYQAHNYQVPDSSAFSLYINSGWDIIEIKGSGYFCSTVSGYYWFSYNGDIIWRYDHYTAKDDYKPRYGREIYLLPQQKILLYNGENYNAEIFDIAQKKIIKGSIAENLLHYLPTKVTTTWRSIVFTNDGRVYKTQPDTNTILEYSPAEKKITASALPLPNKEYGWPGKLFYANDSVLIQTCGGGGLILIQINKKTGAAFTNRIKSFSDNLCNYVFVDRDNRYWIGTEKGIFVEQFLQPVIEQYKVTIENNDGMKTPNVVALSVDENNIFVAAKNQPGLMQFTKDSFKLKKIILLNADKRSVWNDLIAIKKHTTDTLWIGSTLGLGWYNPGTVKNGIYRSFEKQHIEYFDNFFTDSRGDTWISISGPGNSFIGKYNNRPGSFELIPQNTAPYFFPLADIRCFAEDAFGNIWFGGHGIARYNYSKKRFDTSITVFAGYRKFETDLLGLTADRFGNLWIATVQNGLLKYDIKNKSYTQFTMKDGLNSDFILSLACYKDNIFIATRNKINILYIPTGKIRIYSQADGLPGSSISSDFFYDSTQQNIWAGYHDIIVKIPVSPVYQSLPTPKLTIETISISPDSTSYFPSGKLVLDHNQNNLNIGLTNLDFEEEENNILLYRLHPSDEWRNTENNRFIYLDNIRPGEYQLQVKLISIANRWPEQLKELDIIIRPAFWQTWWFRSIIAIVLACIVIIIYRNRVNMVRQKAEQDKMLADLEIKAMHTQMNPHFIFNCMNSIKEMILSGQKENASKYLSTFAQLLRDTLEESGNSFTSLESSINHLKRYIEIEKIRFDNFTTLITVDDRLVPRDIKIPPMLLQPLVENAIWHGLQLQPGEKRLSIYFKQEGQKLLCVVEDNGIGINRSLSEKNDSNHRPIAIENINKRIQLLNEKFLLEYKLDISDKSELSGYTGSGTVATLTIPLDID